MLTRLIVLTACITAPVFVVAQEASQPAPDVAVDSPTIAAPAFPEAGASDFAPAIPVSEGVATQAELPRNSLATSDGGPAAVESGVQDENPPPAQSLTQQDEVLLVAQGASARAAEFLRNGGPSIWAISALSVITVALILWKIWRLALIGAWSRGKAGQAVDLFEAGRTEAALSTVKGRRGIRSKVVTHAIQAIETLPEDRAREETTRIAKREIAQAGTGLRALELIATIAPLLGLLGTVLGMIAAFQALQQAGSRADPALLAGGIWEALLTTAAGMAVAIPASAALTWFEAVIDRIRRDVEDGSTRLFVSTRPENLKLAAE